MSDHSTGAFTLVTFFPSLEELQRLERSGTLQKLIRLFKDFYASVPGECFCQVARRPRFANDLCCAVIEHYRVEFHTQR